MAALLGASAKWWLLKSLQGVPCPYYVVDPLLRCTTRRKDLCPSISRWMGIACIWPFLLTKASCNLKIKEANIFYLNSVHPIYRVILLCRLIILTPSVQNWCLHTSWAYGALFYTACGVCRHRVLTRPVNRLWWTNTVQHLQSPESHRAVLSPFDSPFLCQEERQIFRDFGFLFWFWIHCRHISQQ